MSVQSEYSVVSKGEKGTADHRVFLEREGATVSAFHDVPVWPDKNRKNFVHMIIEIPKGEQAKMEINKVEKFNPIKQDIKNGKLRFVAMLYPFHYGAIPQTWENPAYTHPDTNAKGDNDPLDAVEISSGPTQVGQVKVVKILGVYAMVDEGETDWKLICIDENDPMADEMEDIEDIERVMPGKLKEVFEFLRDYKLPDGSPPNKFAFNNKPKGKEFAMQITSETHEEWKKMAKGNHHNISLVNKTLHNAHTVKGEVVMNEGMEQKVPLSPAEKRKSKKKIVSAFLHVRDITEVDAVKGRVSLDFTLQLFWKDPKLIGKKKSGIDWSKEWSPDVEIYNGVELAVEDVTTELKDATTGEVKQKLRYMGTLSNWMDLHDFPYDQDDFFILVRCKKFSIEDVEFAIPKNWKGEDAMGSSTAVGLMDWNVGVPTAEIQTMKRHTSDDLFSSLVVSTTIRRISGYYFWRLLLILYLIVTMAWTTFFLDPAAFEERLANNLTLFLSIVAFLFTISSDLPKVPYLTFMDKVITGNFLFLFFSVMENYAVFMLIKHDMQSYADTLDTIAIIAFPVIYILFLAGSYIILRWRQRMSGRNFTLADSAFQGRTDISTMSSRNLIELEVK